MSEVIEAPAVVETPTPQKKRWLVPVIIAGAIVVIGAGLGITWAALSAQYSPSAAADRFLSALADGDAPAAVDQLTAVPDGAILLSSADYDAADEHIEAFSVGAVAVDGGEARAAASITQAASTYEVDLPLVVIGSTGPFGLFSEWRVDQQVLPEVAVTAPRPEGALIVANGIEVEEVPASPRVFVTALPGSYEFGLAETGPFVSATPAAVTARLGERGNADVVVELTEEGMAAARAAVDAAVAACVSGASFDPGPGCGMEAAVPDAGDTHTALRWSITTAPTYEIGPWTGDGAEVTGLTPGAYRLDTDVTGPSGSGTAWWTWSDIELGGFVDLVDGQFVFISWYE